MSQRVLRGEQIVFMELTVRWSNTNYKLFHLMMINTRHTTISTDRFHLMTTEKSWKQEKKTMISLCFFSDKLLIPRREKTSPFDVETQFHWESVDLYSIDSNRSNWSSTKHRQFPFKDRQNLFTQVQLYNVSFNRVIRALVNIFQSIHYSKCRRERKCMSLKAFAYIFKQKTFAFRRHPTGHRWHSYQFKSTIH